MKLILAVLIVTAMFGAVACFQRAGSDTGFKRLDDYAPLSWFSAGVACIVAIPVLGILAAVFA